SVRSFTLFTSPYVDLTLSFLSSFVFFFSSRRRHTRCYRDWSSDVYSSDLLALLALGRIATAGNLFAHGVGAGSSRRQRHRRILRSEERRVGKECRSRLLTHRVRKKEWK